MRLRAPTFVLLAASAILLAGCAAPATENDERASVVASTNVYGDIAARVGGDVVRVTSIIDSELADPHSYEASARDRLAVADADVVIVNGGGYDHFMDLLIEADDTPPVVIDVVNLLGTDPADDEDAGEDGHEHGVNEHVWYDPHAITALVPALRDALAELAPESREAIESAASNLLADWEELEARIHALADEVRGERVAITEPVPLPLLTELGLINATPPAFSEAVEEDSDVPPLVLRELLEIVERGDVRFLAYNPQTAGPATEQIRGAAEAAGIPVLTFTETLPDGQDYVSWMTDNVHRIEDALVRDR